MNVQWLDKTMAEEKGEKDKWKECDTYNELVLHSS